MDLAHWTLAILFVGGLVAWIVDDKRQRSEIKRLRECLTAAHRNLDCGQENMKKKRQIIAAKDQTIEQREQKIDQLTAFISGISSQCDDIINDDDRPI